MKGEFLKQLMLSTICKNQTNSMFYNHRYLAALVFGYVIVNFHFDHICTIASFLVLFIYFISHNKTERASTVHILSLC